MFRSGSREKFFSLVICLVVLSCSQVAYAGEPTDRIRQSIDSVIAIVSNGALKGPEKKAERRAEIRKVVDGIFDFKEMSRRAMGLNWRKRTPEEKNEFVPLFEDLIEDAYAAKIERYNGETVQYGRESIDGDYAEVQTKIIDNTNRERDIPVDYMLLKEGAKWIVYDVVIEGVSLVDNYRSQFAEIIDSSSYGELVSRMKRKALKEAK